MTHAIAPEAAPQGAAGILSRLRRIHIENERRRDFEEQLLMLLEKAPDGTPLPIPVRFAAELETRGIALIEAAGGGKTTAIRTVLTGSDVLAHNPLTGAPRFVHVSVESPATQKSLGIAILRETGIDHVAPRGTVWEIWRLVRHRLADMGVVVLWIDEAHDLFDQRSPRELDDMLKMLKSLMQGEAAVIVVLSGTDLLSGIVRSDPQVDRRFRKIHPRALAIGADTADVADLVQLYCDEAGLRCAFRNNLASRLIHASRGRFGRVIETTIDAIGRALQEGADTLTAEHFAEAWGANEGCSWARNVFVAENWAEIDLDPEPLDLAVLRGRHGQRQRER